MSELESNAKTLSYQYISGSETPRSDVFWSSDRNEQTRIMLLDTNHWSDAHATALRERLVNIAAELALSGTPPLDWFFEVRKATNDYVERHGIALKDAFVNTALILVRGRVIKYVGAYAPIYIYAAPGSASHLFKGTVCGIPGLDDVPVETGSVRLEPDQNFFILSDGMLESINSRGKIIGDSLFYAFCSETAADTPSRERGKALFQKYCDAAVERHDSHGMLVIEG